MEQGYIQHIVIGVGINVRKQEFPEEIRDRAAAIDEQCGFRISRSQLIAGYYGSLRGRLRDLFTDP